ncbi:MAG TPA: phospholipid scramblase-related protein [Fimbriiglobus sp.]|nr:phospholipid scramblase-related protein [Fimbriiglobus sp.]
MLESRRFLVKERVKVLASHHTYDILDADTGEPVGTADEVISGLTKLLRWFVSKQLMGTRVEVREKPDDSLVFTLSRGWYVFRSRVEVHDAQGALVGYLKSKLISWSGGFHVSDRDDRPFAEVTGNLIGFNYRMTTPDGAVELGRVSKQWKGIGRELFTSADWYLVEIDEDLDEQPMAKMLVLAAALATDMIFKSESRTTSVTDLGG